MSWGYTRILGCIFCLFYQTPCSLRPSFIKRHNVHALHQAGSVLWNLAAGNEGFLRTILNRRRSALAVVWRRFPCSGMDHIALRFHLLQQPGDRRMWLTEMAPDCSNGHARIQLADGTPSFSLCHLSHYLALSELHNSREFNTCNEQPSEITKQLLSLSLQQTGVTKVVRFQFCWVHVS